MKKNYFLKSFLSVVLFSLLGFVAQAQTKILYASFDGVTGGNNTSTSGSGTSWSGDTIFTATSRAYQAGGAVKLGTSSAVGSMTTIPLDLSVNGGAFKVKLKVKGWTSVEGKIIVTVGSLKPDTLSYSSTISNQFEEIEASFTGGTAATSITISTSAKRAFIDEVTVYYGGDNLSNDASLSDLTVDGITVSGFSSSVLNYFISLPASTATLPTIAATATDVNATMQLVQPSAYNDTAYVNVTAQNNSTQKQYVVYFSKVAADGEKGSKSNPYTINEALAVRYPTGTQTEYWVKGYIVGTASSSGSPFSLNSTDVATNLVLANSASETDVTNMIPVELPSGSSVRTDLNIVDTPANKGVLVAVSGNLVSYFNTTGVKGTSEYVILQTSGVEMTSGNETVIYAREGSIYVNNNSSAKSIEIYNVLGTLVLKTQASEGVNKITLPVKQLYLVKVGGLVKKVMVN